MPKINFLGQNFHKLKHYRQTDRQTDTQTERQTQRHTDRMGLKTLPRHIRWW